MQPGDVLLVYSDGATEAQNSCADDFDEERLGQVLLASRGGTASQIVQAVSAAVTEFCAGTPLGDDLTLVVAKL
jgi:sigma-B regulation protein RsbU (phosphoserine phosphatase)